MLNMLSISTAITMLVMATCSAVVDAAPTAHAKSHAAAAAASGSATRIPGLEKIKHVVYFMQVSVEQPQWHRPCVSSSMFPL